MTNLAPLLAELDCLRPVRDADIEAFGTWLRRTRGIEDRPISDYKSRLRRALTDGSEWEHWTSGVQASTATAVRAYLEHRTGRRP